jgi:hypothetical protein
MPAQCRLVEVKPLRRAREVQLLSHGDEEAELPQVDVHISSSMQLTHESSTESPLVSGVWTFYLHLQVARGDWREGAIAMAVKSRRAQPASRTPAASRFGASSSGSDSLVDRAAKGQSATVFLLLDLRRESAAGYLAQVLDGLAGHGSQRLRGVSNAN